MFRLIWPPPTNQGESSEIGEIPSAHGDHQRRTWKCCAVGFGRWMVMNSLVVAVLSAQSHYYIHHRPEAGNKMLTCWTFLGGIQHSWAWMQQCLLRCERIYIDSHWTPGEMGDDFYVLRQGEASVTVHTTKGDKVGVPFIMLHLWGDALER